MGVVKLQILSLVARRKPYHFYAEAYDAAGPGSTSHDTSAPQSAAIAADSRRPGAKRATISMTLT